MNKAWMISISIVLTVCIVVVVIGCILQTYVEFYIVAGSDMDSETILNLTNSVDSSITEDLKDGYKVFIVVKRVSLLSNVLTVHSIRKSDDIRRVEYSYPNNKIFDNMKNFIDNIISNVKFFLKLFEEDPWGKFDTSIDFKKN